MTDAATPPGGRLARKPADQTARRPLSCVRGKDLGKAPAYGVSGILDIGFAEAETLEGGIAYWELAGDRRAVIAHPLAISLATCTTSHTRSSPWVGVW